MRATRGMSERFGWGGRGRRIYYSCGMRSLEAARRSWHGAEPCGPDVGQQPHCDPAAEATTGGDRDEDDNQHLGAIWRGGAVVAREVRRHVHVRGHSVETELVALDVLHHEARLVVAIGKQ